MGKRKKREETQTNPIEENKTDKTLPLILHVDDRLPALADADPLDGHAQIVLDQPDVVLGLGWQFAELAHPLGRGEPAGHGDVVDLDLAERGDRTGEVVDPFAVQVVTMNKKVGEKEKKIGRDCKKKQEKHSK